MIVDSHQHFWRVGATEHDWDRPATLKINRSFCPGDLTLSLKEAGIDATIVVQSANSIEETWNLLAIAETTPYVAGVIGWVPLMRANETAAALLGLRERRALCGLRHLTNTELNPDWIVQKQVLESLALVADAGLVFDAVPETPTQLEHICAIAERLPNLKIVLDHLGRPPLVEGRWEPWSSLISRIAEYPNVAVKLSVGLDVVSSWPHWDFEKLRPYLEHAIERFGPARAMAASNWPVILLAGTYSGIWNQVRASVAAHSVADQAKILGQTAKAWYRLQSREALQ